MVEPPGPIPNPEVKRRSADGSETIGLVRVGRRQVYARPREIGAGLFFWEGRHPAYQTTGFQPVVLLADKPDELSALTSRALVRYCSGGL